MNNKKLAGYIREKDFTQKKLAKECGLSVATINRLVNGDDVSIRALRKVISTLRMPKELIIEIFFPNIVA